MASTMVLTFALVLSVGVLTVNGAANVTRAKAVASSNVVTKSARSGEFHHYDGGYYPHHHHFGHYGHFKELEHYLMPALILLGFGVLIVPVMGVLMGGLAGNVPVTTLVSGRKRRDAPENGGGVKTQPILDILQKVEKAIELYNKLTE